MGKVLLKFFVLNKKNFIVLLVILLIGFALGIASINNMKIDKQGELSNYINGTINDIKGTNEINKINLLLLSIKRNCVLIIIIWLLGCTIIGGLLIYFAVAYKGFVLGYTISALVAVLGIKSGIIFSLMSLLIQNLIYIPAILLIAQNRYKII